MKKILKTISNQGHGKIGYLLEFSEIEVIALQKYFSGRRILKGSPLNLAIKSIHDSLAKINTGSTKERLAKLLNPRLNHNGYKD